MAINATLPPPSEKATTTPTISSLTGKRTLYDPNAGLSLENRLQSQFEGSNQYRGLLDRYAQSRQATAANTQATGKYIQGVYGGDINYEKLQTGVQKESEMESRRGFATNVAALTNLQKQGDQRVKQLTDQANNALMANNSAGAAALADLAVREQEAITTARTNFLNQYFATQQESRAQATFRTPEQTAVISLAQQYPGAGITDGDTLADAQAKISASPLYQANLSKVQQDIETAKAQAAYETAQAAAVPLQTKAALMQAGAAQTAAGAQSMLAGAQSEQTRFLTDLYKGGSTNAQATDVQALLSNSATPQSIQAKYANVPNGGLIASNILSQAQAKGYNLNAGTLSGLAQQKQTETLNSGNLLGTVGLGVTNLFNTGSKTLYNTTDVSSLLYPKTGATQNVNGKTYSFDGKNWVAK